MALLAVHGVPFEGSSTPKQKLPPWALNLEHEGTTLLAANDRLNNRPYTQKKTNASIKIQPSRILHHVASQSDDTGCSKHLSTVGLTLQDYTAQCPTAQ